MAVIRPANADLHVGTAEKRLPGVRLAIELEGHKKGGCSQSQFPVIHIEELGIMETNTFWAGRLRPGGRLWLVAVTPVYRPVGPFLDRSVLCEGARIQPHIGSVLRSLTG